MSININSGPSVAVIDQNNVLSLSWSPAIAGSNFQGWDIYLTLLPSGQPTLQTDNNPPTTFIFSETVGAGEWAISMTPVLTSAAIAAGYASTAWDLTHDFPTTLPVSDISLSTQTAEIGQPVTFTLNAAYTGADQWRLVYQDGTASPWQPVSQKTIATAFATAGQQTITVQALRDYSLASPPVRLMRTAQTTLYVMNQQYNPVAAEQASLVGTLGLGGTAGFDVITASTGTRLNYAAIVRAIVRDTVTNELKLLVATTRYAQASSLLGTMALDVFPLTGRPRVPDLIELPPSRQTDATTSSVPVTVQTTVLPQPVVGKAMVPFQLQATGGTAPYAWFSDNLPAGLILTIDGTISGAPLTLGTTDVHFSVQDSSDPAYIATTTLTLAVVTDLKITSTSLPTATVGTPYSTTLTLTGGVPPYTWEIAAGQLVNGLTIQNGSATLSGVPVSYNSTTDFSTTFSGTLQVTDAIGAVASAVATMTLLPAELTAGPVTPATIYAGEPFRMSAGVYGGKPPYTLVSYADSGLAQNVALTDGRVEWDATPAVAQVATQNIILTIKDSANTQAIVPLSYTVAGVGTAPAVPLCPVFLNTSHFDHWWYDSDSATATATVSGNLGGFTINPVSSSASPPTMSQPGNGLAVSLSASGTATVAGPPTAGHEGNSEVRIPIELMFGTTQVAQVSRAYQLVSHGSAASTSVGTVASVPPTLLVGQTVTINPLRPWLTGPTFSFPAGDTVALAAGTSASPNLLPPGLSLDSTSGLIYGTVAGAYTEPTTLRYLASDGVTVDGTVTVTWDIVTSQFALTGNLGVGQIQAAYSGTISSVLALSSFAVHAGTLPAGITFSVSNTTVTFSGTPTEAGHFDVWFTATASNGQQAFMYKRFAVQYITPLVILTNPSLPTLITSQAYSEQLTATGGVAPYTWSLVSGTLPTNVTLSSAGLLSGTTTDANNTSYSNIVIGVTDSRNVQVTQTFNTSVNNTLRVSTTALPIGQEGVNYSFQIVALGGTAPYSWVQTNTGTLNLSSIGLALSSGGVLSGDPSVSSFSGTLALQVTDSATNTATASLALQITASPSGLTISSSGVGQIPRGAQYHGTLTVSGTGTAPYVWVVSPLSANQLPTGLSLAANASDQGLSAAISGSTTVAPATIPVEFQVTDANGNTTTAIVNLVVSNPLSVTTTALPLATTTVAYSTTLTSSGAIGTVTWSISSGSLPSGLTLAANTGVISGTPTAAGSSSITFEATDSASAPADTATAALTLTVQATNLAVATASLATATAGTAYSATLQATGGTSPYAWSLDTTSPTLPNGLSLSSSGTLSGTTSTLSTTNVIFRVTDNVGAIATRTLALTVGTGAKIVSGNDYINNTNTGYLGYTANGNPQNINPRPNDSFLIFATGLVSTSTDQLQVKSGTTGVTLTVVALQSGIATIQVSGALNTGTAGTYTLPITLVDSGITVRGSLTYVVYDSLPLFITPSSGSLPTYVVS